MSDITSRKADLRRSARARRDGLDPAYRQRASRRICDHLAIDHQLPSVPVVAAYLPLGSEVDPRPIMQRLSERGVCIAVPAIVDGDLQFRELCEDGGALEPQGFGTHAPGASARALEPEVLLVPLLAFDGRCARIGYGKGFYDRAIARLRASHPRLLTIGLAFDAQEVEEVPIDARDRFLDRIVTESGVRVPSASASPPSGRALAGSGSP